MTAPSDSTGFGALIGLQAIAVPQLEETLIRLVAATVLGAFLAYRPWRKLLAQADPVEDDIAQSQLLIAIAGVVMVVVIGDSTARAFGLVGLGAFVRFRSGIKDPRDAAAMFMMIGIGMSCGLGLISSAAIVAVYVAVVMFVLDATERSRRQRVQTALSGGGSRPATVSRADSDAER